MAISTPPRSAALPPTPSIQRYVILEQTHAAAIVFVRRGQDWLSEVVAGHGAVLHLPEIGIDVPLAEVYRGLGLRDDPAGEPAAGEPSA